MDRATTLTFLRSHATALRLQATGYASTSKVRAGLVAQASALETYAAAIEAAPAPDPTQPAPPSVFLLLI